MPQRKLILGIDIGTTSVKVVVIDTENNEIIAQQSKDTQANVPSDLGKEGNKQDVPKIISALNACVAKLKKDLFGQIIKIGVCGQMHGMMLWKNTDEEKSWEEVNRDDGSLIRYDVAHSKVSHLYTWQDSRCDAEFLASMPPSESHLPTYTGYGCATLYWMSKNKPHKLENFNCAGTIQDFAVAVLCDLKRPIMSVQNAASWGYFDCSEKKFNTSTLEEANFPVQFLPEVKESGEMAGVLAHKWHSIPKGVPVGVALGDLQCSVLATLVEPHDAVLNISTSAQLAFVAKDFQPEPKPVGGHIAYYPYFSGNYLAVAASLNGGNALATFVQMLQQWTVELGFSVPQSKIWEKIIALGQDASYSEDSLQIEPTLLGERGLADKTATVKNIHNGNLSLGSVFRSLCHGLVENLYSMMSKDILLENGITRIVGNGSGLSRNKILQKEIQEFYKLPLVFTSGGDAAKGAAIAMKEKLCSAYN